MGKDTRKIPSKFNLCSNERQLVKLIKVKMKAYGNSNKELIKKENELFHLLCFLSLSNEIKLLNVIQPNEPGDFLIIKDNKKTMVEVVECFGNAETYIDVKYRLNFLFGRNIKNKNAGRYTFTIKESVDKLNEELLSKNNKNYLNDNSFDEKILLVVTGEYENCPVTGNWLIKFLEEKHFLNNRYDGIWILDYFSSGKDGNPMITKDIVKDIIDNKCFYKDNSII